MLYVSPAVFFDAIVGAYLTFGLWRNSGIYKTRMPLTRLIMRDGLLYFVVVFGTNIFWILAHVFKANNPVSFHIFCPVSQELIRKDTGYYGGWVCTVADVGRFALYFSGHLIDFLLWRNSWSAWYATLSIPFLTFFDPTMWLFV